MSASLASAPTVRPTRRSSLSTRKIREEWIAAVRSLEDQIRDWVKSEPNWEIVGEEQREIDERSTGLYSVSILTFKTPLRRVVIEPLARNFGGRGAVEVYLLPTLRRVHLLYENADRTWRIFNDSGIPVREPWGKDVFVQMIEDMTSIDE